MGTNFYLHTKNKEARDKYFSTYELTDIPDWAYEAHIAKTSCGWLPLFQAHKSISSVRELKEAYDTGHFRIIDEYNRAYSWNEFEDRVLKFNGGILGVAPREKIVQDKDSPVYDADLPEYMPISHFEYGNGKNAHMYFKDEEGYEFTDNDFL